MFAARFDPSAVISDDKPVVPLKRRAEEVESDGESDGGSDGGSNGGSDGDDSSDNSSDESTDASSDDSSGSADDEHATHDPNNDNDVEMIDAQEHNPKFSSILSRFNQSIHQSHELENTEEQEAEVIHEEVEQHAIAPLPQPALPRDHRLTAAQRSNNLNWLAQPLLIKTTELKPFEEFDISPQILKNLHSMGFNKAFASQIKTLELLLPEINNKLNPDAIRGDVLVNASTGSGKTLAYTIPVIQSLMNRVVPRVRCIILVPTRPLINQVFKTLIEVSKGIDLNIVTLGKSDVSLREESRKLIQNVPDIVVTTPGRLVDHLNMESFKLDDLQWCVIDEADKLLNQSFQDWSNVLISKLQDPNSGNLSKRFKRPLTKMIFSATLTTDAGKLSALQFRSPRLILVNNEDSILQSDKIFTLPSTLKEHYTKFSSSNASYKPLILLKLLQSFASNHTLVFTKSNDATLRLSTLLKNLTSSLCPEIVVNNINSQLNSSTRAKLLSQFEQGTISVLVATDLIARGLDLKTIRNVVNYDLPPSSREYVHRVGRTARAGDSGDAYTIVVGRGEGQFFERIGRDINRPTPVESITLQDISEKEKEIYQGALNELQQAFKR